MKKVCFKFFVDTLALASTLTLTWRASLCLFITSPLFLSASRMGQSPGLQMARRRASKPILGISQNTNLEHGIVDEQIEGVSLCI